MEVHEAHQGPVEWSRVDEEEVKSGEGVKKGVECHDNVRYYILVMCIKEKQNWVCSICYVRYKMPGRLLGTMRYSSNENAQSGSQQTTSRLDIQGEIDVMLIMMNEPRAQRQYQTVEQYVTVQSMYDMIYGLTQLPRSTYVQD